MKTFLAYIPILLLLIVLASSEPDLRDQDGYPNPVDDLETDHPDKDQDKRTIFQNNHGWAKHVGLHPSGFRYVIGYGPVDLRYVPVVRPIAIKAHRPKLHLKRPPLVVKPLLPVRPIVHQDGWKPMVPLVRPVVPLVKPVLVPPHKPWHQEGWHDYKPVHVHPAVPVQPVVPVKPAVAPIPVKPVVQIVPAKPIVPVVPAKPIVPAVRPLPPLFGTFPILQVPTGAGGVAFIRPGFVGQYTPGPFVHFHGATVPQPVFVPQTPHVHPHVPVEPHVHAHALNPHVHSVNSHLHVLPQQPIGPHVHLQVPHVDPHVHVSQPVEPHVHPHVHVVPQAPIDPHVHVQVPHIDHSAHIPQHPQVFQQQLPQHPHQVFTQSENPSFLYQQQLPGNVQHLFNQHIQHGEGAKSSILLQGSSIQPGQTDVQLPLHLPQHPNYLPEVGRQFQPGNFHDPSQHPESIARPAVSLEPPYTHK